MRISRDVRPTRARGRAPSTAALTLGLLLVGCDDGGGDWAGGACAKDAVCRSTFGVTVKRADPGWTAGVHEVTVAMDGAETHCLYAWPPKNPTGGVDAACAGNRSGAIQVRLRERTTCAAGGTSCTSTPGHFTEEIGIAGTPGEVEITRRLDGVLQGIRAFYPVYEDRTETAGACTAVCRNATVDWDL